MTALTSVSYRINYPVIQLARMSDEELHAAASVWFDKIIGYMAQQAADYTRFGWFIDARNTMESVLYAGLLRARRDICVATSLPGPVEVWTRADVSDPWQQGRHDASLPPARARVVAEAGADDGSLQRDVPRPAQPLGRPTVVVVGVVPVVVGVVLPDVVVVPGAAAAAATGWV